ncbi:MAG TPA: type VI secretion system baseplate subunit TssE [Planctomycetota bacterium]|nr:type VI secretion system baseplate subunit TssE [Planctomycetota bacterium]
MARETSLFDRLSRPAGSSPPSSSDAKAGTVRAVLENLQRLLNSRQGHAAAQMGYGIPDPSEVLHAYTDAISAMAKAIKASIDKYEPRLTGVQVRHVANPDDILVLRYQIVGQLAKAKERIPVVFDTHVDPSGRIRVVS